ncbi:MAG: PQQ-dependent sugar dehydrogenase, partial [Verrucomicrobiota bacterium]
MKYFTPVITLLLTHVAIAQNPKFDQEAELRIKSFEVKDNFTVELFADEEQVINPSAICFDDKGGLFVGEIHRWRAGVEDIRHHIPMLVDDLSIVTSEDRLAMYRKHSETGYLPFERWTEFSDSIRLVKDRDGDGRADLSTIWADDFDEPLDGPGIGLVFGDGKLYYTNIPHLWALADGDGDGKAEQRESIQDGFGVRMSISGHDMHGAIFGPDGRLYWSIGDRGYTFKTKEGKQYSEPTEGAVFRCEPDGSNVEVYYLGLRNPQELAFDAYGNLFTCDNDADAKDTGRLVYILEGGDSGWDAGHQALLNFHEPLQLRTPYFPKSKFALNMWLDERIWEKRNEDQPAWILPPIELVSWGPSGLVYNYGATAFPEKYENHFWVCNFGGAKGDLEMFSVKPKGAGFKIDTWKNEWMVGLGVTDAEFGPGGKLYISCFNNNGWV